MARNGRQALPASVADACLWLTFLNSKPKANGAGLSYSTINNYRWAAHAAHTDYDLPSPFGDSKLVLLMLQSIRKARAAEGETPAVRLPVTRATLLRAMPLLNLDIADDLMLAAAMWVATVGLLRPGEIGVESIADTKRMLTIGSLTVIGGDTFIHLKESKTDTTKAGVDIKLRSRYACDLLERYLATRPLAAINEPLFRWSNGKPLLHGELTDLTTKLLAIAGVPFTLPDGSPCRGVSFRKGGASDLANTGVSDKAIQLIGRWKSFCSLRYVHPTNALLDAAAMAADAVTNTTGSTP